MHAHVAVPRVAEIVTPHLKQSTDPLVQDSTPETQALMAKQAADIRTRISTTDERFSVMDEMGVDMQLVCPAPPQIYYYLPVDVGVQAARALNDGIAEYVGKHTDRLVALGGVPMQDGNEAAKELERCMKQLRLQGRRDSHQRQRQGAIRSRLRAVLEEGRGARRAGADPPHRLHPAAAFRALLLQQRDRQSARYHGGAALPDLRRRVRTSSEASRSGRARRRLSSAPIPAASTMPGARARMRTATCRSRRRPICGGTSISTRSCSRRISLKRW